MGVRRSGPSRLPAPLRRHRQGRGTDLGLACFLAGLTADPRRFILLLADLPLLRAAGLRSIPLTRPDPLYAWSLPWRFEAARPALDRLITSCATEARRSRRLEDDPSRDLLPDPS